ncbi:MAG TPA: polyprenyl diphosphate synthase [Candidatus Dormibacteraeota bacterium]|nr:polyprenyl diphosphate synthase [Candidatus Dormibacteraeota bacterium]
MLQPAAVAEAPEHVAVIMDGNRRWARDRGLPIAEGYRRGIVALREAVKGALETGVRRLTVYGFSTENWTRDAREVNVVTQLCAACARSEKPLLVAQGVRVELIGDLERFAFPVRAALRDLVRSTAHNTRLTLSLALNYSGRAEILRAVRAIAADVAAGRLEPSLVDENALRERMYAPHAPDPDLLVRTGGDQRISNFLLYQLAYTELLTLPHMWPDFTAADFTSAIEAFGERRRRYGA